MKTTLKATYRQGALYLDKPLAGVPDNATVQLQLVTSHIPEGRPLRIPPSHGGEERDPAQVLAAAEQAGVDVAGLRYNLSLSPEERIAQFLKALAWLTFAEQSQRQTPHAS